MPSKIESKKDLQAKYLILNQIRMRKKYISFIILHI